MNHNNISTFQNCHFRACPCLIFWQRSRSVEEVLVVTFLSNNKDKVIFARCLSLSSLVPGHHVNPSKKKINERFQATPGKDGILVSIISDILLRSSACRTLLGIVQKAVFRNLNFIFRRVVSPSFLLQ